MPKILQKVAVLLSFCVQIVLAQAWGANYVGQLGDNGTGDNSPVPVDVYAIDNLKTIASVQHFHWL